MFALLLFKNILGKERTKQNFRDNFATAKVLGIYKTYEFKNFKWLLQGKLFDKPSEENTIKTNLHSHSSSARGNLAMCQSRDIFFHFRTQNYHYSLSLDTWLNSKENHKAKSLAGGFNMITKERSLANR